MQVSQFKSLTSRKIWEELKLVLVGLVLFKCGADLEPPLQAHSPPLQGAPVTGDAPRNVGSSLWRRHLPISFSCIEPRGHGTLHLGWDLRRMCPLVGIPLPLVIVAEGKLEFIGDPFIHFVLHHWHAVGFRATPIQRTQREEKLMLLCLVAGTSLTLISS